MKLTKATLKRIIKEEITNVLNEDLQQLIDLASIGIEGESKKDIDTSNLLQALLLADSLGQAEEFVKLVFEKYGHKRQVFDTLSEEGYLPENFGQSNWKEVTASPWKFISKNPDLNYFLAKMAGNEYALKYLLEGLIEQGLLTKEIAELANQKAYGDVKAWVEKKVQPYL